MGLSQRKFLRVSECRFTQNINHFLSGRLVISHSFQNHSSLNFLLRTVRLALISISLFAYLILSSHFLVRIHVWAWSKDSVVDKHICNKFLRTLFKWKFVNNLTGSTFMIFKIARFIKNFVHYFDSFNMPALFFSLCCSMTLYILNILYL